MRKLIHPAELGDRSHIFLAFVDPDFCILCIRLLGRWCQYNLIPALLLSGAGVVFVGK